MGLAKSPRETAGEAKAIEMGYMPWKVESGLLVLVYMLIFFSFQLSNCLYLTGYAEALLNHRVSYGGAY